jgi:hypothetical protein
MFQHCNIHKFTWASADGEMHNQIDHILIGDSIQVYLMSDYSDCDTDHYLVVAKVRERLAVSK